jgi:hypothetical protein
MTNEEEGKDEGPSQHEQNMRLMQEKFGGIIQADKAKLAANPPDQNPHSRAYNATCSFTKNKTLTKEEERRSVQGYHADKSKKLQQLKPMDELKELARKNLITGGGFPQAKVDDLFSAGVTMKPELVQAFLDMQKACVKFRLSEDADFEHVGES